MFMTNQEKVDDRTMRIERRDVVGSGFIQFPPQKPFSDEIVHQPPTVSHEVLPEYYVNNGAQPTSQVHNQENRPVYSSQYRSPQVAAQSNAQSNMQNTAPNSGYYAPQSAYAKPQQSYMPPSGACPPPTAGRSAMAPGRGRTTGRGRTENPIKAMAHDAKEQPRQLHNGYSPAPSHGSYYARANHQGPGNTTSEGRSAPGGAPPGRGIASSGRGYMGGRGAPAAATVGGRSSAGRTAGPGMGAGGRSALRSAVAAPQVAHTPAYVPQTVAEPQDDGSDDEAGGKLSKSQMKRLRKKKRDGKA